MLNSELESFVAILVRIECDKHNDCDDCPIKNVDYDCVSFMAKQRK